MKYTTLLTVALSTAFLTACGGGGGGEAPAAAAPVPSTVSFPLQSAFRALVASGYSKPFTISGTCAGTGNVTYAPATTAVTFEGVSGFSAAATYTYNYTNCTPASSASTKTNYFDTNYIPRGYSTGSSYGVYLTPLTIPATVTVGGTGVLGSLTEYTNSTKSTLSGRMDVSYVVEADTATTAIVNVIVKSYNVSGTLTSTEQDRYRITTSGTMTLTSFDLQYANGSTAHLVGTF